MSMHGVYGTHVRHSRTMHESMNEGRIDETTEIWRRLRLSRIKGSFHPCPPLFHLGLNPDAYGATRTLLHREEIALRTEGARLWIESPLHLIEGNEFWNNWLRHTIHLHRQWVVTVSSVRSKVICRIQRTIRKGERGGCDWSSAKKPF